NWKGFYTFKSDPTFWKHEWEKHGSCISPDNILKYFQLCLHINNQLPILNALKQNNIYPSSTKYYSLNKTFDAIHSFFGNGVNPIILCNYPYLKEFRYCLDDKFQIISCPDYFDMSLRQCSNEFLLLNFTSHKKTTIKYFTVLLIATLIISLLIFIFLFLLKHFQIIETPFEWNRKRNIEIVHYDLIDRPVIVHAVQLPRSWLEQSVLGAVILDFNIGVGAKGARRLMKQWFDFPNEPMEKIDEFDLDLVVIVDESIRSDDKRTPILEQLTQLTFGGMNVEAKDIEILTKFGLTEYFLMRDVTQNELLILKTGSNVDDVYLFYTDDCFDDMKIESIRPSVHTLASKLKMTWSLSNINDPGIPHVSEPIVVRTLMRYFKGGCKQYEFDQNTWSYFKKFGLNCSSLFNLLKPIHNDTAKYFHVVNHLLSIGFLSNKDLQLIGGANRLWGYVLHEMNDKLSNYGIRLTFDKLSINQVHEWIERKKLMIEETIAQLRCGKEIISNVNENQKLIDHTGLILLFIFFLSGIFKIIGKILLEYSTMNAMKLLVSKMFENLLYQNYEYLDTFAMGELISRTSADSLTIRSTIGITTFNFISQLFLSIGCLSMLFYYLVLFKNIHHIYKIVFCLILLLLFIIILINIFYGSYAFNLNRECRRFLGAIFGFTFDIFSNIKTILILNGQLNSIKQHKFIYCQNYFSKSNYLNITSHLFNSFIYLLTSLSNIILLVIASRKLINYSITFDEPVSIKMEKTARFLAIMLYLNWLIKSLQKISTNYARLMISLGSLERIKQVCSKLQQNNLTYTSTFDTNEQQHSSKLHKHICRLLKRNVVYEKLPDNNHFNNETHLFVQFSNNTLNDYLSEMKFSGCVSVENASFKYSRSQNYVLNKISFCTKQGKILGIIGKSSSGKSTIINLLSGIYFRSTGELAWIMENNLWLKGSKLTNLSLWNMNGCSPQKECYIPTEAVSHFISHLRSTIGICSKSTDKIFSSLTILDNFLIGITDEQRQSMTINELYNLCDLIGLNKDDLIDSPQRFTKESRLSSNQIRKISFARCLLKGKDNLKLLLIDDIDEMIDIDNYNNDKIVQSINMIAKNWNSTIVITGTNDKIVKMLADDILFI
ncbi:unnamed protein product, partial [Didymodactylos carnosus]